MTEPPPYWPLPLYDPASPQRWDANVPLPAPRSNRPVQPIHHFEFFLSRVMNRLYGWMGLDRASAFMGGLFRAVGPLVWVVNNKGLKNLRYAMPENTDAQNREILKDVWDNFGRTIAEFALIDEFKPFSDDRFELEGAGILEDLVRNNRQAIYFSGHFANWELMSPLLYRAGVRNGFVYRSMNNPLTDEWVIERRASAMSRVQMPKGKQGSRELLRILNDGYSLLIMADQKLNTGMSVPFLGKPAMTAVAAARMAIKYKLPLVPVGIQRLNGARFKVIVRDPIIAADTGQLNDDIYAATLKMNDVLGDFVRENPGDWLWFHTRWGKEAVK